MALEEYPLVGGADDVLFAQRQVRFDGNLLVEAGLFDPHDVGDAAQLSQPVRTHDDAELGRVIKHDRQVGVVRQYLYELHYLVFGFGGHVGRPDDQ